jgi:gliding motility-associated-like protein
MNRLYLFLVLCLVSYSSAFGQINCRNTCLKTCQDCTGKQEGLETVCDVEGIYPTGTVFEWDMGDGAKYATPTAVHTFAGPGVRTVRVTIRPTVGSPIPLTKQVYITQMPRTFLGTDKCKDTLELCSGTSVINAFQNLPTSAYPNPSNLSVTWFPNGETTDQLTVDKEGCYSVKIKDNVSGCYSEARLRVIYCQTNNGASSGSGSPFWSLGSGNKINFTSGTPTVSSDPGFNAPAGSSSFIFAPIKAAKNTLGGIYTNGDLVKTFSGNIVANLGGDINLSQATAILPKQSCSGCDSEYYIFGMKQVGGKNQLFYSVFDISGNGGLGSVIVPFSSASFATPISSFGATDKLVITQAGKNEYWINAFEVGTKNIYRYKLDSLGLSKPNRYTITYDVSFSSNSTLVFSPKNDRLAVANDSLGLSQILIMTVDTLTGNFDQRRISRIQLGTLPAKIYGVAFSPDGKVLYVTTRGNGSTIKSQILQFDLTAANVESTKFVVYETADLLGELKLDPDNSARLYIAIENKPSLAFIRRPNVLFTSLAIPGPTNNFDITTFTGAGNLGRGMTSVRFASNSNGGGIQQSCSGTTFTYKLPEPPKCKENGRKIIGANWSIYEGNAYSGRTSPNIVYDPILGIQKQDPTLVRQAYFSNQKSINYSYPEKSINPKKYVIVVEVLTECGSYFLDAEEFEIRNLKPFSLRSRVDKLYMTTVATPNCVQRNITFPDPILDKVPNLSGLTYKWNTGASSASIIVNTAGIYSYKISDNATGCDVKGDVDLRYYTEADFIPEVAPSVCMDNPTRLLELKPILNPASLEFLWTERGLPLGTNPSLNVTYATTYDMRVRDGYGCIYSKPFVVADKCLPVVLAPNIFTPNGDGVNDRFVPQPLSNPRTQIIGVKIFNRWGELLFEGDNSSPDKQWDGKYKGKLVPQDTYVYAIDYVSTPANFPNMGTQTLKGGVLVAY